MSFLMMLLFAVTFAQGSPVFDEAFFVFFDGGDAREIYADDRNSLLFYRMPDHLRVLSQSSVRERNGDLRLRVVWGLSVPPGENARFLRALRSQFGDAAHFTDLPLQMNEVTVDPQMIGEFRAEVLSSFSGRVSVAPYSPWSWEIRVPALAVDRFIMRVTREEGFIHRVTYTLISEGSPVRLDKTFLLSGLSDATFGRIR